MLKGMSRRVRGAAVAVLALFVAITSLAAGPVAAQDSSGDLPDVTLSISVISLTERDGSTDVTVTATLREPVTSNTTILLALEGSPLLTPGVNSAADGSDYTTTFDRNAIDIASGSLTGSTTFAIDPTYDTDIEGDEAIVVTGSTATSGVVVAPTDLIIEDGPYLSFPRYIYGALHHPGQPVSITVEEAINQADSPGVTAAKVAAQAIVDDATDATQPAGVETWADWEAHYDGECDRVSITYGDAGITVNSVFHVHSGIVRAGLEFDGTGNYSDDAMATGKDKVAFEHTRVLPAMSTIDPDRDPATPGVQVWDVDEPAARPNFAKAMAVCAVEEAVDAAGGGGAVTYSLTGTDPADTPIELTFDPATRRLTGTAPASADVPDAGLVARYTITARDGAGHEATTLVSVAVVHDVCGPTTTTWFGATGEPPPELVTDCNVLLAARDTLRGTGTLNWATDVPIGTPWDGLTFTDDIVLIRKIELQLRNLDGTIPPVLGHLRSRASLDLVLGGDYRATDPALENRLTGPIPPELGLPPNLVVLALSFNNLSGPIPRELANTGKLRSLYLHDTDTHASGDGGAGPPGLSGPIPPEFGDVAMVNLSISGNAGVTGHIPWQLGKNVSSDSHHGLQVLNLYENSLEGNIPWQLGRFGKMQHLGLAGNRLTGAIPWQLGNLGAEEADLSRRVVSLYLNTNQLTGPIPPELGGIANLSTLSLSENQLTGPIPTELGGLSKLQVLSLRDNQLSGPIPPELGDLGNLRHLLLGNNRFTGSIPAELGALADLEMLSLSCNGLSGAVPATIGGITTLADLDLHGNPELDTGEMSADLRRADLTVMTTGECPGDPPAPPPEPAAAPEPTTTTAAPEPAAAEPTTTTPAPEPAPEPTTAPGTEREGGVAGWVIAVPIIAALLAVAGGVAYVRRRGRR